jgi:hypothetical protein
MSQTKIYLPPPSNWQDFQELVAQVARVQYDPDSVQEYGRQGQRQNGVDVFAEMLDKKPVGIQCKETKTKLSQTELQNDIDAAKAFVPSLNLFVIATTERRDTKFQDWVNEMNASGNYSFRIRIDFWDDFQSYINHSAMVLNSCYEAYREEFKKTDETHHLECIRTVFERPAFVDDFAYERSYREFGEALADTMRFFRIGVLRDRWSSVGIIQAVPLLSLPDGKYKASVQQISDSLESLYRMYTKDARRLDSDCRYAHDRAGHYNIERRKLLDRLNKLLTAASLPEINFRYR